MLTNKAWQSAMDVFPDTRTALHLQAKVQAGKKIEITSDALLEGDKVDVFLIFSNRPTSPPRSVVEFLDSLPAGPRSYPSWQEFERRFREERDSWDH